MCGASVKEICMKDQSPELKVRIEEMVQRVRSAPNEQEAADALGHLKRLGAKLSPEEIKRMAPAMCSCGPSGEHPIESWPCW
jgi:hypothetical protein